MKSVILLSSGGVDSAALLYRFLSQGRRVIPLYVRQGLYWERAELYWLRRLVRAAAKKYSRARLTRLHVLDFPLTAVYGTHWSITGRAVPAYHAPDSAVYLPGRNLVLIAQAALLGLRLRVQDIALGPLCGNPFPDSRPQFFRLMERTLAAGLGFRFRIHTPFLAKTKAEVVASARAAVPWHLTFSCLKPRRYRHCGRCNKCREREEALNGLTDGQGS